MIHFYNKFDGRFEFSSDNRKVKNPCLVPEHPGLSTGEYGINLETNEFVLLKITVKCNIICFHHNGVDRQTLKE